jgi:hypothetical protein
MVNHMRIVMKNRPLQLILILLLFSSCGQSERVKRDVFEENRIRELISESKNKDSLHLNEVFGSAEFLYVFPPYYPFSGIQEQVEDFENTFYYINKHNTSTHPEVKENEFLLLTVKDNLIVKCLVFNRSEINLKSLRSNKYIVMGNYIYIQGLDKRLTISFDDP